MLTGFLRALLAALLLVQLPASNAQNVEPFKFFRDYVGLKEDQIAEIQNGKAIARSSNLARRFSICAVDS
jgi:hypothetical protein